MRRQRHNLTAKTFRMRALTLVCALVLAACKSSATSVTPTPDVRAPPTATQAEAVLPYQDPGRPLQERVEDLLSRMTLEEKIGQMTLVEKNSIKPTDIADRFIGGLLSGGGGSPSTNTPEAWAVMVNGFQEHALRTRLGIPMIHGVDAIHGHAAVKGAVVYPHFIGLGATRDPELVERIGRATASDMVATGIYWNYAPVVAVPQDIRWGRTYEGFSEDTDLVSELAVAFIRGLQNANGQLGLSHPQAVLATPKHYVGDGGTTPGSSASSLLDQGVTEVDEATLRAVHLPPYAAAVDAGARSIMVSYSSWGGLKMHANKYLLTDVLRGELGFDGFLVSDWKGIDQIPGPYHDDIVTSINAGLDMIMVPSNYDAFISGLKKAVSNGAVSHERIDDAVRRILTAKFELGLFERPFSDEGKLGDVGSAEHRQLAREAVRKSLVLLKNDHATLPLAKDTPLIFVAGQAADDIGIASGGWSIEWQGKTGDTTPGTTLLEAIRDTVAEGATVEYDRSGDFDAVKDRDGNAATAGVGIAVVGELPYAEGAGDSGDLALSDQDVALIEQLREKSEALVVILISGRPLIITEQIALADAFVAAWLPGSEGQGVADVLFGDSAFTGKLPYTWPRWVNQLPFDFGDLPSTGRDAPLFPFGFGLSAKDSEAVDIPACPHPAGD
jgi:beta-glucosidase